MPLTSRIVGAEFWGERFADFKVPREVRLVAEFPRSMLNTISKKDLRAALAVPREEG